MQNKSSHTKKGAINIADTTIFLLQNPSTTDKIDTKYRVATPAQYGIYTSNNRANRFMKGLKPYLFTYPNPTNVIINWIIS